MKKTYQLPNVLLLAIYDGCALCQTSGSDSPIGEGDDFIWGETSL